jgi:hypothetical protein
VGRLLLSLALTPLRPFNILLYCFVLNECGRRGCTIQVHIDTIFIVNKGKDETQSPWRTEQQEEPANHHFTKIYAGRLWWQKTSLVAPTNPLTDLSITIFPATMGIEFDTPNARRYTEGQRRKFGIPPGQEHCAGLVPTCSCKGRYSCLRHLQMQVFRVALRSAGWPTAGSRKLGWSHKLLVGNKSDLEANERVYRRERGSTVLPRVRRYKMLETSAKSGEECTQGLRNSAGDRAWSGFGGKKTRTRLPSGHILVVKRQNCPEAGRRSSQ